MEDVEIATCDVFFAPPPPPPQVHAVVDAVDQEIDHCEDMIQSALSIARSHNE